MTARVYQERLPKKASAAAEFFFDLANERHVSYRCATNPPKVVTVSQDKDIEECTGGIVWETSFLLATFLEQQKLIRKNAKVLEVGAGCGMLGCVLACHGCRVVLSEATEAMVNLERNVQAVVAAHRHNLIAQARLLRWDNSDDILKIARSDVAPFDLILGTDVIFKPDLVEPLLKAISAMSHPATVVYLCFQERCAESHRLLMTLAPTYFEVTNLSSSLRETQGCHFAQELECWLLQLTPCKSAPRIEVEKSGKPKTSKKKRIQREQNDTQVDCCADGNDVLRRKAKKKKTRLSRKLDEKESGAISCKSVDIGASKKKKRKRKRQPIILDTRANEEEQNK